MTDTAPAPHTCDTLVVGAGPAGSACALWLARQGQRVLLVDQHAFPRDKVCGDGLIPDAHRALDRLGLLGEVMARAQRAQHLSCIAPRGGRVDVPGRLAVLPRRELDDILKRGAERAGARFMAPARFEAPLLDGERVVGARLRTPDGPVDVRAHWVVLATGAVPQALIAADLCERRTPSGVALRGYIRHPALAEQLKTLEVVWHKRLRKGYGWVFPCPDGVFNIGVGLAHSHARSFTWLDIAGAQAARSLGATWFDVIVKVVVPNMAAAVLNSALLCVAIVMGEYTIASLLNYVNLQVAIQQLGLADASMSMAVSLAALIFAFVLLVLLSFVGRRGRRTGRFS